jgi:hypothetical protein
VAGFQGLLTDVQKSFFNTARKARKEHSFKTPVREVDNIFAGRRIMGNKIAKEFRGGQIGIDSAIPALKEPIRLVKFRRRTTLGTLMFDDERGHNGNKPSSLILMSH